MIEAFTSDVFSAANAAFWLNLRTGVVAWALFTALTFLVLRVADRISGIDFKRGFDTIESDPVALAHYFGERHKSLSISGAIIIAAVFLL